MSLLGWKVRFIALNLYLESGFARALLQCLGSGEMKGGKGTREA